VATREAAPPSRAQAAFTEDDGDIPVIDLDALPPLAPLDDAEPETAPPPESRKPRGPVRSTRDEPARMGSVFIGANEPASVYENGRILGITPLHLSLPAGQHLLSVRRGGAARDFSVNVAPGALSVLSFKAE
jgi:hypothetical protein